MRYTLSGQIINWKGWFWRRAGGGFCAEFQAVYDSWTNKPDDAVATAMNTMVECMIAAGIWGLLDIFHVFAVHTNAAGEALTNWISPGIFDATNIHATVFTAFEGFTGDGANDYLDSNYNPNTDAINLALDDACGFLYNRTNGQENKWMYGCRDDSTKAFIITPWTLVGPSRFSHACNSDYGTQNNVTDAFGIHLMSRDNGANYDSYQNKVGINSIEASSAVPNHNIYYLAMNNAGAAIAHSSKQISCGGAGSSFIQQNVDDLVDCFEAYMDSNGKGVLP